MKTIYGAFIFVWLFIASSAFADKPDGSVYLDGGDNVYGLILAHGKGKYPAYLELRMMCQQLWLEAITRAGHDQLCLYCH